LRPVAPARLHKRSIIAARIPDEKRDSASLGFSSWSVELFCVERGSNLVPLRSKVRSGDRTLAQASVLPSVVAVQTDRGVG
jgi:hypothetical protein